MLARVVTGARSFSPPSSTHLWGVILSGRSVTAPGVPHGPDHLGAPTSRRESLPRRSGRARSFRRAVDRAIRLIAPERVVAVLSREDSLAYEAELSAVPAVRRVLQPSYRGSAAEVLLPVMQIVRRDPDAVVVVLPGDQAVDLEARFMSYVAKAAIATSLRPDVALLLAAPPSAPDGPGPWIEPGALVDGLEHLGVRYLDRFIQNPGPADGRALYEGSGLESTGALVATARTLLALGRHYLPEVLETLEPLDDVLDAPEEPLLREALWECMPYASLAEAILERGGDFGVLPVPDLCWRDRTRPEAELLAS
jgi:mannose-1-phosphate guanylyltransferase